MHRVQIESVNASLEFSDDQIKQTEEEMTESEEINYIEDQWSPSVPAVANTTIDLGTSTPISGLQQRKSQNELTKEVFLSAEKPPKIYFRGMHTQGTDVRWCTRCESWQCMACCVGSACLVGTIGLAIAVLIALDA